MSSALRFTAYAKLNLFLHITGKRSDGYHFLESLTSFTEFGDHIDVSESDTLSLEVVGPFAQLLPTAQDDNLVMRAAQGLQHITGCGKGARIILHKHIPVGAGLGGGSADAAALLRGLAVLWQVPFGDAEGLALAQQLGSDVAACLVNRPAWVTGTGEKVQSVTIRSGAWVVLANPRLPLLTADVYRKFTGPYADISAAPTSLLSLEALTELMRQRHNALEAPATALLPVIRDIVSTLSASPHCAMARMSGSGATCFGLYRDAPAAQEAARQIQLAHPQWWVQATPLKEDQDG
jgi:4-diphosphocytidyl-2-C-methyl-D-erythritol kinase